MSAAFTIVEGLASRCFRRQLEHEPSVVEALGSAFAFLSVGGALGAALVSARLTGGIFAWPIASFISTLAYLTFVGFEIALAEKLRPGPREADETEDGLAGSPEP